MEDIKQLDANILEIHYWLANDNHSMDAKVCYTCQQELLGLIEYIAKQFGVTISIETFPLVEGGIKTWLKTNGLSLVAIPLIVTIVGNILSSAPSEAIGELIKHQIEEYLKSPEVKELEVLRNEKEKLILEAEIAELKGRSRNFQTQHADTAIRVKRSNYYQKLINYKNLERISFEQKDHPLRERNIWEGTVSKEHFSSYQIDSSDVDPVEHTEAMIEIVAPILKRSKRKWRGIYKKKDISFRMSDQEFQNDVYSRKISFSNGSIINCLLIEKQKINGDGEVVTSEYEVIEVNNMSINGVPQEVIHHRKSKKKENDYVYPSLFSDMDT